ncbi:hypothetical protein DMO24_13485 [Modestobacter versicolor]|uniref:Cytochrome P450 n=1 Tax=Modestobacter versicolor TaxID=429133 RepID=A0A323V9Q2_9ACTN|nr:hypothetical protein DMO24_13485 [Modestobacter versicolor]
MLLDPRYRVPPAPPADAGVAWLRASVPRFTDGPAHTRRRALVDRLLAGLPGLPDPGGDPTTALLLALGLPAGCRADVELVAGAYQPHAPQSAVADAAADRLVDRCGGRTEEAAARVCVLVQAHAAMQALLAQLRAGAPGPPVPVTRRVGPDGRTVEVDLAGAPFGAGPHACPGRALAEARAAAVPR